ncbi:MAG: hypothetical protein QM758_10875 [Armatimonas sp.]
MRLYTKNSKYHEERKPRNFLTRDSILAIAIPLLVSNTLLAAGWTTLNQGDLGFRLEFPDNWSYQKTTEDRGRIRVSLLPPSGPAKIAIDSEFIVPGDDPMRNFELLDRAFRGKSGYRKLALKPRRFKGFDAAYWEFTKMEKGIRVHKIDIGFHVGSRGYAVLLNTPQSQFQRYASIFEHVASSLSIQ